jgi:hypothetical protein
VQRGHNSADSVLQACARVLLPLADRIETLTYDNGKEFASHAEIATSLGSLSYFAKPYHSWKLASSRVLAALASPPATKALDPDPFPCRSMLHCCTSDLKRRDYKPHCRSAAHLVAARSLISQARRAQVSEASARLSNPGSIRAWLRKQADRHLRTATGAGGKGGLCPAVYAQIDHLTTSHGSSKERPSG